MKSSVNNVVEFHVREKGNQKRISSSYTIFGQLLHPDEISVLEVCFKSTFIGVPKKEEEAN